jgi:tetratricopeptide (TPR) repeat protein
MLFLPLALATFQPRPEIGPAVVISAALTLALACGVIARRRKNPDLFFGFAFFFLMLAPKIVSLVLSDAPSVFSDYDSYLASIGPLYWAARALERALSDRPGMRKAFTVFYTAWILWISMIAAARTAAWESDVAVWSDVLKHYPDNETALLGRGRAYRLARRPAEAAVDYRRALEVDPGNQTGWFGLAQSLADTGSLDEAERTVREALDRWPEMANGWSFLGALHPFTRGPRADGPAERVGDRLKKRAEMGGRRRQDRRDPGQGVCRDARRDRPGRPYSHSIVAGGFELTS